MCACVVRTCFGLLGRGRHSSSGKNFLGPGAMLCSSLRILMDLQVSLVEALPPLPDAPTPLCVYRDRLTFNINQTYNVSLTMHWPCASEAVILVLCVFVSGVRLWEY